MHQGLRNGDDAFNLDDEPAVPCALDLEENSFASFHRAAGHADSCPLREVEFARLEVEQGLVVVGGDGNELSHLVVRDDDLAAASHVHHVLHERDGILGFEPAHF